MLIRLILGVVLFATFLFYIMTNKEEKYIDDYERKDGR